MLSSYEDIRDAAKMAPFWHDGNGVPRFAKFHPDMLGVYDRYALLVLIECQACSQEMLVGEGWPAYGSHWVDGEFRAHVYSLEELAKDFRFGDPPWHGCKGAGESMLSISVRIVEAWHRPSVSLWERCPDIEAYEVYPEWAMDRRR